MSADVLQAAFASTAGVLANVSPDQMDLPTPCASWKVRDLVNHVVGGAKFFAYMADNAIYPGRREMPDFSAGDYRAEFGAGASQAVNAFSAPGVMEKTMELPFGKMPGSAFMYIAAIDAFTHAWDLARATGQGTDLDPPLAEQLLAVAKTSLPDGMRGADGVAAFGPECKAGPDAGAADRLAAFMGRQP